MLGVRQIMFGERYGDGWDPGSESCAEFHERIGIGGAVCPGVECVEGCGSRVDSRAGLRLSRAVLASNGGGTLNIDTLKNRRARTVPLVATVVPIIERWAAGKQADDWLFHAPEGGPLRETNWKRSVRWREAVAAIGRPQLRVHDLRHTAASTWLGSGADPKVVQRVLGHASAAMTMDLYGHLIDRNLWDAADRFGGTTGAPSHKGPEDDGD